MYVNYHYALFIIMKNDVTLNIYYYKYKDKENYYIIREKTVITY